MGFFDFFKKKPKINGAIAYFNLQDWWLNELTENERNLILEKAPGIIEGNISSTSRTVVSLLTGMVGMFAKPQEVRFSGYKLIQKIESLIDSNTSALDIHFLYSTKVEFSYKDRDTRENGLEYAIEACNQQIEFASKAANAFKKSYKNSPLPSHKGYTQLAIVKEKQKDYQTVITICKKANSQGWAGDWDKRIERCQIKLKA